MLLCLTVTKYKTTDSKFAYLSHRNCIKNERSIRYLKPKTLNKIVHTLSVTLYLMKNC